MKKTLYYEIFDWIKAIVFALILALVIERFIVSITIVKGQSMLDTINNKDRILIDKVSYHFTLPQKGDIVIFKPPIEGREKELFIKRVIAIEGDSYKIEKNNVYINEERLYEDYIHTEVYVSRDYMYCHGIVPKGYVFVMGDNRNNSNDSRNFGIVPVENIIGRAFVKLWPINGKTTFTVDYPAYGDGLKEQGE